MNATKIELNFSAIHGIIRVCQDRLALSIPKRPKKGCGSIVPDGIKDLQKRTILLFGNKVRHLRSIGEIIRIPISAKGGGRILPRPSSKCHWPGVEAKMLIGKVA